MLLCVQLLWRRSAIGKLLQLEAGTRFASCNSPHGSVQLLCPGDAARVQGEKCCGWNRYDDIVSTFLLAIRSSLFIMPYKSLRSAFVS